MIDWPALLPQLALPGVILVCLTSLALLLSNDWRYSLLALVLQYLGAFLLVAQDWSFSMAAAKLVAGWFSAAILGMALNNMPAQVDSGAKAANPPASFGIEKANFRIVSGKIVFLFAAALIFLVVLTFSGQLAAWLPGVQVEQAFGGLTLIGIGWLQLGYSGKTLSTLLGIFTFLSGFEVIYAAVEPSILVAGLLAGLNLGIALVGAYLLQLPSLEAGE